MADFDQVKSFFEFLSYVVVAAGVPLAIYEFMRSQRQEREEREHRAFDRANAQFIEYQRFCIEHPYLDVHDYPHAAKTELTEEQKRQELIALTMLFSIFESAFIAYKGNETPITRRQWAGWDRSIRWYFRRSNVLDAWRLGNDEGNPTFDPRFEDYLNQCVIPAVTGQSGSA
jgi:hypothetical protein